MWKIASSSVLFSFGRRAYFTCSMFLTGQAISNHDEKEKIEPKILKALAEAYHRIYTGAWVLARMCMFMCSFYEMFADIKFFFLSSFLGQTGRPFFGMRDYYALLKFIRIQRKSTISWDLVLDGLCRYIYLYILYCRREPCPLAI